MSAEGDDKTADDAFFIGVGKLTALRKAAETYSDKLDYRIFSDAMIRSLRTDPLASVAVIDQALLDLLSEQPDHEEHYE